MNTAALSSHNGYTLAGGGRVGYRAAVDPSGIVLGAVWVGRGPTTGPLVFSAPFSVRLGNKRPPGHQLNRPIVLFDPPCGPMGSCQVALGTPIGLDARFHFSPNPPERYRTSV